MSRQIEFAGTSEDKVSGDGVTSCGDEKDTLRGSRKNTELEILMPRIHLVQAHCPLVFRRIDFDDDKLAGCCFCLGVDSLLDNQAVAPVQPLAVNIVHQKNAARRGMIQPHVRLVMKIKNAACKIISREWFLQVRRQRQFRRKSLGGRKLERVVEFNIAAHGLALLLPAVKSGRLLGRNGIDDQTGAKLETGPGVASRADADIEVLIFIVDNLMDVEIIGKVYGV